MEFLFNGPHFVIAINQMIILSLFLVHGLKMNHGFEINHLFKFGPFVCLPVEKMLVILVESKTRHEISIYTRLAL